MIDLVDSKSRISKVYPKRDAYPMIVEFQHAQQESTIDSSRLMYVPGVPGQTALLHSNNIVYAGKESDDKLVRNLVLARNKKTGDVRLIEVGRVVVKADLHEEEPQPSNPLDTGYLATKQKFGSKRQKRAIDQRGKTRVDVEATKEQTEAAIMNIKLDEVDAVMQNSDVTKYAPPVHRDALDVHDVYVLEEILTPKLLSVLNENSETILEGNEDEFPVTEFTKKIIRKLRGSPDPSKLKQCSALLYADCLISYLTDSHRKVRDPEYMACEYAEVINENILSEFSMPTSTGLTRPQSMEDKALCYILVLLLIANNYLIPDLEELTETLKKPKTKIIQMVKVIGARLTTGAGIVGIVLKLPLVAPPVANVKRVKRR